MSESLWPSLQRSLRDHLDTEEFRTWIRPLRIVDETADTIVLEGPNDRFVKILEESFRESIDRAAHSAGGQGFRVVLCAAQLSLGGVPTAPALADETRDGRRTVDGAGLQRPCRDDGGDGAPTGSAATAGDRRPVEARVNRQPEAAFVARPRSASQAPQGGRAAAAAEQPRFNPRYRFSNFVVGNSNQFACAAARAVAESPGHSYNPLFLYGGVGLGKTHLLHAIAQEIMEGQPHLLVHYISAEQFVNELINSIRFDRMPLFRERYRTIDVLLIDDIQFLANKERTQEEFFHTFNALYTAEKQIILSSDSSPKDIPTLEERLRSRFEWGLITDIQPPDLETKVAILRRKAAQRDQELDDEVAMFIAKQVRSNVRELEGLLNRVVAFSSMSGRPLDVELARETLHEILPDADPRRNAAEIIRTVAKTYGLRVTEIKSRSKAKQIAFPRQVAMYLCKQLTDLSFPEIGKQFNDKHHSTVMHSVDKITRLRDQDPELDRSIERLILQLR